MARRRSPRTPRTAPAGTAAGSELRLPIWQFVRLMVAVEETLDKAPDRQADMLMQAWSDDWREVDAELTRRGETDADAFAQLMMDQEIVLEAVTPALAKAVAETLTGVVRTMRASLKSGPAEGQRREDLQFEIAELEKTLTCLPKS